MQFDSITLGARFLNVTAAIRDDMIQLNGTFIASADLIPVLLFSVGVPWVEPCVRHICCLWDVAERYRDHDLMAALGPTCDEHVNLTSIDLMKGNPRANSWSVNTMIHPSFVAMLFVVPTVMFYMYYEIIPLQWVDSSTVHWRSSWYGQPCHPVIYPDGREVCIYCSNSKPANAVFVFSANWFTTFQCQWICKPGFAGPNCDITVDVLVYALGGGMVVLLCVVGLIVYMRCSRGREEIQKRVVAVPPPPKTCEIITFKENAEIRIKLL